MTTAMPTTTRTIGFNRHDGHAIVLDRNDGGAPVLLDYVWTRRRLTENRHIKNAACDSRRYANRVAILCRIMDPKNEYRTVELSGWGWVIKKRDHFTNTVSTVTHIGALGGAHQYDVLIAVSEIADLCGYNSTATFTY